MKNNARSADFCADRTEVITNFAVITNAVIKRVHCIRMGLLLCMFTRIHATVAKTDKNVSAMTLHVYIRTPNYSF